MKRIFTYLWEKRAIILILLFTILVLCLCNPMGDTYAGQWDEGQEVKMVADEKELITDMIQGMKEHQTCFLYYYPGIIRDFNRYSRNSSGYAAFFQKVALRNGYVMGIVTGSSVTISGRENPHVMFQFGYLTTKKQERYIDKRVRVLAKKFGKGTRAVRIRRIHDYLIDTMQYDSRYYTSYSALKKGRGNCMSYALTYQRIMQELDIPCLYVTDGNHAWNRVKIKGVWYNVDVTWDDLTSSYNYFLKYDSDFVGHVNQKWVSKICK